MQYGIRSKKEKQLGKDYRIRRVNSQKISLSLTEQDHKLVLLNRNLINKWLIHINKMIKMKQLYHLINHLSKITRVNIIILNRH